MKAVAKYDPSKGAKLSYYASWWIRSYILKYILDNFRLVKIGTTQAQKKLFYHLIREKDRLEAQGISFGPKLLAEKLDVREKDVSEMAQRLSSGGSEVSLDAPMTAGGEGRTATFSDALPDDAEPIDEKLAREEWLLILKSALPKFKKTLSEKEKRVLDARILSENPKTLQEVADEYGLTRERVRQIESKLIVKLRDQLKTDSKGSQD
jgi:RNA polymerase sigma-32 factor